MTTAQARHANRVASNNRLRAGMREIRQSGIVGGGDASARPYLNRRRVRAGTATWRIIWTADDSSACGELFGPRTTRPH